jgi:hypothetical protein
MHSKIQERLTAANFNARNLPELLSVSHYQGNNKTRLCSLRGENCSKPFLQQLVHPTLDAL